MPQFETGSTRKLSIAGIVAPQQTRVTTADDINNLLGTVAKTTEEVVKVVDNETLTDKSRRYNEARANYSNGLAQANGDPATTMGVWNKFKKDTQALVDEGGFINEQSQNSFQGIVLNEVASRELYHNNIQKQYSIARYQDGSVERLVASNGDIDEFYKSEQEAAKLYGITDMNLVSENIVKSLANKMVIELSNEQTLSEEMIQSYSDKLKQLEKIDKKLVGKDYYIDALSTIKKFENVYNNGQLAEVTKNVELGNFNEDTKGFNQALTKLKVSESTKEVLRLTQQNKKNTYYKQQVEQDINAIIKDPDGLKKIDSLKRKMVEAGYSKDEQDSIVNTLLKPKKGSSDIVDKILKTEYNSMKIQLESGVPQDPLIFEKYNKNLGAVPVILKDSTGKEIQRYVGTSKEDQQLLHTADILWSMKTAPSNLFNTSIQDLPPYSHTAVNAFANRKIDELYASNVPDKFKLIAQLSNNYNVTGNIQQHIEEGYNNPEKFDTAYQEAKAFELESPLTYNKVVGTDLIAKLEMFNKLKQQAPNASPEQLYLKVEQALKTPLDFREPRVIQGIKNFEAWATTKELTNYAEEKNRFITKLKMGMGANEALKQLKEEREALTISPEINLYSYDKNITPQLKENISTAFNFAKTNSKGTLDGIFYNAGTKSVWLVSNGVPVVNTNLSLDGWSQVELEKYQKVEYNKMQENNKNIK